MATALAEYQLSCRYIGQLVHVVRVEAPWPNCQHLPRWLCYCETRQSISWVINQNSILHQYRPPRFWDGHAPRGWRGPGPPCQRPRGRRSPCFFTRVMFVFIGDTPPFWALTTSWHFATKYHDRKAAPLCTKTQLSNRCQQEVWTDQF